VKLCNVLAVTQIDDGSMNGDVYCVWEKVRPNVSCNTSYKTLSVLVKFGTPFLE